MDVHPPHHPIATKRDFFVHLFTITCGLLIALGLEGLAEMAHHHSLVVEARTNIRHELEDNRKATEKDIRSVGEDEARFRKNLDVERAFRDDPNTHGSIQAIFSWDSTYDSAWRTARDTGALAYMPYAEVQRYSDVYGQQAIANNTAVQLFRQQTEAVAPILTGSDPSKMPKEEMARMLHDTSTVYVDLQTLQQLLKQLRDQYGEVLRAK